MKARDVKTGEWFFVKSKKQWFKKTGQNQDHVEAMQIGVLSTFNIPLDEEVLLQKGDKT